MKIKSVSVPYVLAYEDSSEYNAESLKAFLSAGGGYDAASNTFKPLSAEQVTTMHLTLDSITVAVEKGLLDSDSWTQQLFADEEAFETFLRELSSIEDCYRINDRNWYALFSISGAVDEEGVVRGDELADALREASTM